MPTPQSITEQEIGHATDELGIGAGSPTFEWKGIDYVCTYKLVEGQWLDEGGFVPQDVLTLTVSLDDLPNNGPQLEDLITFQDKSMPEPKKFRVKGATRSPGSTVTFQCHSLDQGA